MIVGTAFCAAWPSAPVADDKPKEHEAVVSTGRQFAELKPFDELMEGFVRDNELPGAALAVAKEGRLVYARGFGYVDVEKKQPVKPESLFRIASISKPFTAVAILQLVEQGRLALDTPVFGLLPHKPHLVKGAKADPRLGQVTIAHLLRHQGGWDRKETIDPLFHSIDIASVLGKPPPATQDDVIRFMMGWQLDFDPGERYVYSNLGYCLLGRVIEQVTGRRYGDYMVNEFLRPLGIESMRLGKTLLRHRAENEVKYYPKGDRLGIAVTGEAIGAKVLWPYGAWSIESFDSLGGWIASAPDLVRFGSAVDRYQQSGVLQEKTIATMIERPAKGHFGNDEKG
ncbi:MAG: serine hydrolase domain-containing protein, partial [Verrucomicrobiota bacterium]|nr:serine hydrolase domain-containing protein [Verrucomicrobiota bacterium]